MENSLSRVTAVFQCIGGSALQEVHYLSCGAKWAAVAMGNNGPRVPTGQFFITKSPENIGELIHRVRAKNPFCCDIVTHVHAHVQGRIHGIGEAALWLI